VGVVEWLMWKVVKKLLLGQSKDGWRKAMDETFRLIYQIQNQKAEQKKHPVPGNIVFLPSNFVVAGSLR
jgi:hypothetical protein